MKHESDAREILEGLITLVGANCSFDLGAPEEEIAGLVLDALGQPPRRPRATLPVSISTPGDSVEVF